MYAAYLRTVVLCKPMKQDVLSGMAHHVVQFHRLQQEFQVLSAIFKGHGCLEAGHQPHGRLLEVLSLLV